MIQKFLHFFSLPEVNEIENLYKVPQAILGTFHRHLLLVLFLYGSVIGSSFADASDYFPKLVTRAGKPGCWVRWEMSDALKGEFTVCETKQTWEQSLATTTTRDRNGAENLTGRWNSFSPLQNNPDVHSKKILLTFRVSKNLLPSASAAILPLIERRIEVYREQLSHRIIEQKIDPYGILRHLLLNESHEEDPAPLIRDLGFIHLISASGIHLCALSLIIEWLALAIGQTFLLPIKMWKRCSRTVSVAVWVWGWTLAGWRAGMLRPWLLILLQSSAQTFGFRWRKWIPLILAMMLDVCIGIIFQLFRHQPLSNFDWDAGRSFYLFAFAGAGFLSSVERENHWKLSVASWILDACWDAVSQGMISLFTPLFSLITIPLVTLLMYPSLIIFSLFPDSFLIQKLNEGIAAGFNEILGLILSLALLPGNIWIISSRNLALIGVVSLSVFVFTKKYRSQALAFLTFTFAVYRLINHSWIHSNFNSERSNEASQVVQIDVGQGDGALIESNESEAGLIDTGSEHSLSDSNWLHFFAEQNLERLRWAGLSHLDEDHAGGLLRIAKLMRVDCATTSDAELTTPRGKIYEKKLIDLGVVVDHHLAQCVPFPTREPTASSDGLSNKEHSANENMSAFFVPLKGGGFYVGAGDATREDERNMIPWIEAEIKKLSPSTQSTRRILKISHHGSKTSSDPSWIAAIRPTEAWISDGIGNHYGHPALMILEELEEMKIPIRRTDEQGCLVLPK